MKWPSFEFQFLIVIKYDQIFPILADIDNKKFIAFVFDVAKK